MKKSHNLPIGETLRIIRNEKQMSLAEVSRLSGVPIGSIGDIERGRATNPSFVSVARICRALNISPALLLEEMDQDFAVDSDIEDISYLYNIEYLNLFRDYRFKKYFEITKQAYNAGIKPEALAGLVDVLISQSRNHNHNKEIKID